MSARLTALLGAIASTAGLSAQTIENPPVFEPTPAFFQVVSGQLNALDPNSGGYTSIGAKLSSYNAAGYNVLDQYAYAWGRYAPFQDQLIRIHGDGTFVAMGKPVAVGPEAPTTNCYAGDMDFDGNLWIRGDRFGGPSLMKINVTTNTYEMVGFTGPNPGSVADLVYMKNDGGGVFYGARNQDLYVWDVDAKTVAKVPVKNLPAGGVSYGAAYTDSGRALYVSSNLGGVYRIIDYDTPAPRAVYLLDSVSTNNNDGFSCPELAAPIIVPANQPPTITISDDVVVRSEGMSLTLKPVVGDEGLPFTGSGLQVEWTQEAGPAEVAILQPDAIQSEFQFTQSGNYTLRLNASDGELEIFEDVFVTVGANGIESIETYAPNTDDYHDARLVWTQVKEQLHCRKEGTILEVEKRGFETADYHLERDAEVIVTVIYDGAAARNSLGWYDARTPDLRRKIWHDYATGPSAPLQVGSKASLGVLPAGTDLRFYLVQDGARGGEGMIYQDADKNPGGYDQIAARLFTGVEGPRPKVIGFEDIEYGGDLDFNDVIFQVEFIEQSLGDTEYHNVIPGHAGIMSDRGSRGVHQRLGKLGMGGADFEITSQLFVMPDQPLSLEMLDDRSSMKFDLCAFDYDAVKMLQPSSLAFRKRAAEIAVSLLDDRLADPGQPLRFDPAAHGLGGKTVGLMIVPNNTREVFLRNPWRYTPKGEGERTKRQPLFSLNSANPGTLDQLFTFQSADRTVLAMEDYTRLEYEGAVLDDQSSDSSFDDAMITISPKLVPADIFPTGYYQGSFDPTYGYEAGDGYAPNEGPICW